MLSLQIYRRILFMKPTSFLRYDIIIIMYHLLWIILSPVIMALLLQLSPNYLTLVQF